MGGSLRHPPLGALCFVLNLCKNILFALTLEYFFITIRTNRKKGVFLMSKEKFQITLPESAAKILKDLSSKKGFSKSIIIAMALQQMSEKEKEESNGGK